jgi:predicted transposase YbfD/YdcC
MTPEEEQMDTSTPAAGTLCAALAHLRDPRRAHRRVHELTALLQMCVAAMLCGSGSLYAIAQWGRERLEDNPALLIDLGLQPGRYPSVATLHRLFRRLDIAAFEAALGQWLARTGIAPEEPLAVDGKTLRGIHGAGIPGAHLVSVYALNAGAVLAQIRAPEKGAELPATKEALAHVELSGRVVLGDALQTQREVCEQIVAAGGAYLFPVKGNQSTLLSDVAAAFAPLAPEARPMGSKPQIPAWMAADWKQRGVTLTTAYQASTKKQHGRIERREMWVLSDPELVAYAGSAGSVGEAWPHLAQVYWVRRERTKAGVTTVETGYGITCLSPKEANARRLLGLNRAYWGIENRLHWVRDVTLKEDHSQIRSGAAPQACAALRNLGIALLRRSGASNIAAALRTFSGRPHAAVSLVLSAFSQ